MVHLDCVVSVCKIWNCLDARLVWEQCHTEQQFTLTQLLELQSELSGNTMRMGEIGYMLTRMFLALDNINNI